MARKSHGMHAAYERVCKPTRGSRNAYSCCEQLAALVTNRPDVGGSLGPLPGVALISAVQLCISFGVHFRVHFRVHLLCQVLNKLRLTSCARATFPNGKLFSQMANLGVRIGTLSAHLGTLSAQRKPSSVNPLPPVRAACPARPATAGKCWRRWPFRGSSRLPSVQASTRATSYPAAFASVCRALS